MNTKVNPKQKLTKEREMGTETKTNKTCRQPTRETQRHMQNPKERNTRMPSVNQKNPKTRNTENAKRPCPVSSYSKSELSHQCLKCLKHKEECY